MAQLRQDEDRSFYADRDDLIRALQSVPENGRLYKNAVGNLSVVVDGQHVGYVDIHAAEYVAWEA